jgi:hypothetical protein
MSYGLTFVIHAHRGRERGGGHLVYPSKDFIKLGHKNAKNRKK